MPDLPHPIHVSHPVSPPPRFLLPSPLFSSQDTLASQGALLANVPQRHKYPTHRYLPPALDKTVSAERNRMRDAEERDKGRLKAQAEAAGKSWDPASFVSKYEDESDMAIDRSTFTLRDMVTWGVAHPANATDALLDLIEELRVTTEYPVLVAVDGLNLLYGPTPYPEAGSGELLPPERLSIPAAFQCVGPDGFKASFAMKRGLWLASVSWKHSQEMRMFETATVRDRFRVPVGTLSRQEVYSTLAYYAQTKSFMMLDGERYRGRGGREICIGMEGGGAPIPRNCSAAPSHSPPPPLPFPSPSHLSQASPLSTPFSSSITARCPGACPRSSSARPSSRPRRPRDPAPRTSRSGSRYSPAESTLRRRVIRMGWGEAVNLPSSFARLRDSLFFIVSARHPP